MRPKPLSGRLSLQNIEREGERDGGREGEIVTEACARVRETESERERERERERRERETRVRMPHALQNFLYLLATFCNSYVHILHHFLKSSFVSLFFASPRGP